MELCLIPGKAGFGRRGGAGSKFGREGLVDGIWHMKTEGTDFGVLLKAQIVAVPWLGFVFVLREGSKIPGAPASWMDTHHRASDPGPLCRGTLWGAGLPGNSLLEKKS